MTKIQEGGGDSVEQLTARVDELTEALETGQFYMPQTRLEVPDELITRPNRGRRSTDRIEEPSPRIRRSRHIVDEPLPIDRRKPSRDQSAEHVRNQYFPIAKMIGRLGARSVVGSANLLWWMGTKRKGHAAFASLLAVTGASYIWLGNQDSAEALPNCTDHGHELVQIGNDNSAKDAIRGILGNSDNKTFTALAERFQAERGYAITADDVARANPALSHIKGNSYSNNISFRGTACTAIPGYTPAGIVRIERNNVDTTIEDFSRAYHVSIQKLTELNPGVHGLADPNQTLQVGQVLEVHKPDADFVLRQYTVDDLEKDSARLNSPNQAIRHAQVKHDNLMRSAFVNPGDISIPAKPSEITSSSLVYADPVTTQYMIDHHLTPAAWVDEYANDFKHLGPDQTLDPAVTKPVIVPERPNPAYHETAFQIALQAADEMQQQGGDYVQRGEIMKFVLERLHKVQAARKVGGALAGNGYRESVLDPQAVQGHANSATLPINLPGFAGNLGYGAFQLTSLNLQKEFIQFCADNKLQQGTLDAQLQFVWEQLNGPYRYVLNAMLRAKSVEDAATQFMGPRVEHGLRKGGFEDPAAWAAGESIRRREARNTVNMFDQYVRFATPSHNPQATPGDKIAALLEQYTLPGPFQERHVQPVQKYTTAAFRRAIARYTLGPSWSTDYTDCEMYLATAVRPFDPAFPRINTWREMDYLQHSSRWQQIPNRGPNTQLKPGDIFVVNYVDSNGNPEGHTSGIVQIGGKLVVAEASQYNHGPQLDTTPQFSQAGHKFSIFRFKG